MLIITTMTLWRHAGYARPVAELPVASGAVDGWTGERIGLSS